METETDKHKESRQKRDLILDKDANKSYQRVLELKNGRVYDEIPSNDPY